METSTPDIRAKIVQALQGALIGNVDWTFDKLADAVLSIKGVAVVEVDESQRDGLDAYVNLLAMERNRRDGVHDLDNDRV
jgi:hypothetical protein